MEPGFDDLCFMDSFKVLIWGVRGVGFWVYIISPSCSIPRCNMGLMEIDNGLMGAHPPAHLLLAGNEHQAHPPAHLFLVDHLVPDHYAGYVWVNENSSAGGASRRRHVRFRVGRAAVDRAHVVLQ